MTVRVVLTVDIRPGEEQAFESEFEEVAGRVAAMPDVMRQVLCRDPGNPSRYLIMSDWPSWEAFRRFEVSPEQDEATAPVRAHRSAVQMAVYDVVLWSENAVQSR